MARAPKIDTTPDAIEEVLENDKGKIADDLQAALDAVSGIAPSNLKFLIHKITKQGKWEFCKEATPPFAVEDLMEELRDEFGAGEYTFRIMANGKLAKVIHFGIAQPKTNALISQSQKSDDLLPLLISQMNQSKSDNLQMMQMMMQQQSQSAQMQMQMMQQSQQTMMGLMTAIISGKEKPGEMIAAFATMGNLFKSESGGLKETVETIAAVKGLFGDGGGNNDDSWLGMAKSMLPAIAPVAGEAIQAVRESVAHRQAQPQTIREIPRPQTESQNTERVKLPPQTIAPAAPVQNYKSHPVIDLIRDDVLYFLKRAHEPELAADAIYDVLEKEDVKFDALIPLVLEFQSSDNWARTLNEYGIPVTTAEQIQWFNEVITHVAALFDEGNGDDNPTAGEGGGETDAGDYAATGEALSPVPEIES